MQNYAQLEACLLVSLVLEGLAPLVVALGVCVAVCVVPLRAQRDEAVFLLADAKQHDATAYKQKPTRLEHGIELGLSLAQEVGVYA